jgi:hypothetical protein
MYQAEEKQRLAKFYGVPVTSLDLPAELWGIIRDGHAAKYEGGSGTEPSGVEGQIINTIRAFREPWRTAIATAIPAEPKANVYWKDVLAAFDKLCASLPPEAKSASEADQNFVPKVRAVVRRWNGMDVQPTTFGEYEGEEVGTGAYVKVFWRKLDGEQAADWYYNKGVIAGMQCWESARHSICAWRIAPKGKA